jgi:hypothetical protein
MIEHRQYWLERSNN